MPIPAALPGTRCLPAHIRSKRYAMPGYRPCSFVKRIFSGRLNGMGMPKLVDDDFPPNAGGHAFDVCRGHRGPHARRDLIDLPKAAEMLRRQRRSVRLTECKRGPLPLAV